jgi:dihydroceramide fatty acyl 2-hydroxylase
MSSATDSSRPSRTERLRAAPPLARSRLVNRLLRVSPRAPVLAFGPVIVALGVLTVGRMPVLVALAWGVAGVLFWTLAEYWIHRVILHLEPEGGVGAQLH